MMGTSVTAMLLLSAVSVAGRPEITPPTIRVAFVSPALPQPHRQENRVLFNEDFDRPPNQESHYFEYNNESGSFVWSENGGYGGHNGAMKCQFESGLGGYYDTVFHELGGRCVEPSHHFLEPLHMGIIGRGDRGPFRADAVQRSEPVFAPRSHEFLVRHSTK